MVPIGETTDNIKHSKFSFNIIGRKKTNDIESGVCYSAITYTSNPIENIKIYLNPKYVHVEWVKYCLNCPQFGEVFPNKNIKHQFKHGFEISNTSPRNLASFGMSALRMCQHFKRKKAVEEFLKMGYEMEEVFILCHYFYHDGKKFQYLRGNTNHHPLGLYPDFSGFKKNKRLINLPPFSKPLGGKKLAGTMSGTFGQQSQNPNFGFEMGENNTAFDSVFKVHYKVDDVEKQTLKEIENFITYYRNIK